MSLLKRKFYKCSFEVKIQLFLSYCMNIYCVSLWSNCGMSSLNRMKIMYNNAFRILMGFNARCSASTLFVKNNVRSFYEMRRNSMYSLFKRLRESDNQLVCTILSSDLWYNSSLLKNWYNEIFVNFN